MNYLYCVQGVDGGPIKIGVSSQPAFRLTTMQIGSPIKLGFVAIAPTLDAYMSERFLHKKHAENRLHGEWFNPSEDLMEDIKEIGMYDFT